MRSFDVVIIGAGLAGQQAALAAAEEGVSVGIVSRVQPVCSHSTAAAGAINAAVKPGDSWQSHVYDTVEGSDHLGDQHAIELTCRAAPDEILHLEHLGATFHSTMSASSIRARLAAHRRRARSTSPTSPARRHYTSSTSSCSSTMQP
jgi:succinate dehydrogenase/fumarate reductase flavoprotein subunit